MKTKPDLRHSEPENVRIKSQVPLNSVLRDMRPHHYGMLFGNVSNLCKQYGIKVEKAEKGHYFIAPKNRLQMFAEKLHFAGIRFKQK